MLIHVASSTSAIMADAPIPSCTKQISLRFLPNTKSGTNDRVLALHNVSDESCRMLEYPVIVFRDSDGKVLRLERATGFKLHYGLSLGHGPAIPDIVIPVGRTATISLSWNDAGPICFNVNSLTFNDNPSKSPIAIDQTGLMLQTKMCGDTTDYLDFRQGVLTLQP